LSENILDKCYNKIFKDKEENINHSQIEIKDIIQKEDSIINESFFKTFASKALAIPPFALISSAYF